ncbi:EAL domain protein, partial [Escherichia coli 95.0183]
ICKTNESDRVLSMVCKQINN